MADNRAGYWRRRTANLAKEVAVASREAREAKVMVQVVLEAQEQHVKEMVRVVQEAHDKHMEEMRQLLAASLQQQAADVQGLLAPLVRQRSPARVAKVQWGGELGATWNFVIGH